MLGTATNPRLETGDIALRELGRQIDMERHSEATQVSVFFGQPAETVRYGAGSGFWYLLMGPRVYHQNGFVRLLKLLGDWLLHPLLNLKVLCVDDWAKRTQVLLFMQTVDSTLRMVRGRFGLATRLDAGPAPTAFMPEAIDLSERYAAIVRGKPVAMVSETLLGIPSTAHILGGACMGRDAAEGGHRPRQPRLRLPRSVRLRRLDDLRPGVNPSLSITAISECAMSRVPPRDAHTC